MNEHHSPIFNTIIALVSSVISWITLLNAQYILSFILTVFGIVNVIMGIRYYYYAGNEKRNKTKNK